jgi:hypothetical protein
LCAIAAPRTVCTALATSTPPAASTFCLLLLGAFRPWRPVGTFCALPTIGSLRPIAALLPLLSFGTFRSLRRFCSCLTGALGSRRLCSARRSLRGTRPRRPAIAFRRTVLTSGLIAAAFLTPALVRAFLSSAAATIAVAIAARAFSLRATCFTRLDFNRLGRCFRLACEPAEDLLQDGRLRRFDRLHRNRGRLLGRDALNRRLGAHRFRLRTREARLLGFGGLLDQLVAGWQWLHLVQLVVP